MYVIFNKVLLESRQVETLNKTFDDWDIIKIEQDIKKTGKAETENYIITKKN